MADQLRLTPLLLILSVVLNARAHEIKKIQSNPDGILSVGFKMGHIISGIYTVDVPAGDSDDKREVVITGPDVKDSIHMKFKAYTMVFSDWGGLFMLGDKVFTDELGSLYFFDNDDKCTKKVYKTVGSEVMVIDDAKLEKSACSAVRERVMRAIDEFLTTPFSYMLSIPTLKLQNTPGFPGGDYVRGVTEGSIQCGQFSVVIPRGDPDVKRNIQISGPGVYEEVQMNFDYGTAVFGRWDGYFYLGDKVFSLEPQTLVIEKEDGSCEKRIYEKQGTTLAATQKTAITKEDCLVLKKNIISAFEKLVGASMIMQEETEYIYSKKGTGYNSNDESTEDSKSMFASPNENVDIGATTSGNDGEMEGTKYSSEANIRNLSNGTPQDLEENQHLKGKHGKVGNEHYNKDEIAQKPSTMSKKMNKRMGRIPNGDCNTNDVEDKMNDGYKSEKRIKRLRSQGDDYGNDGAIKFKTFRHKMFADDNDENHNSRENADKIKRMSKAVREHYDKRDVADYTTSARMLDDDDDNDGNSYSGDFSGGRRSKLKRVKDQLFERDFSDYYEINADREHPTYVKKQKQRREQPSVFVTSKVIIPQSNGQESGRLARLSPRIFSARKNIQPMYSSRDTVGFLSDGSKTNNPQYAIINGVLVPVVNLGNRGYGRNLRFLNLRPLQDLTQLGTSPNIHFTNRNTNEQRGAFSRNTINTSNRGNSQSLINQAFLTRKLYRPVNKPYILANPDVFQNNEIRLNSKNVLPQPIVRMQTNKNNAFNVQASEVDTDISLVDTDNVASSMKLSRHNENPIINLQSNKVGFNQGKSIINIQRNEIGKQ